MGKHTIIGLVAITIVAIGQSALAQAPRGPADDVIPIIERSQLDMPKSKSDGYRLVGKVLEIDKAAGTVKLSTDEGERVVKPSAQLLAAIRVGDTISVPRAEDPPVSASPRTAPRGR